MPQQPALLWRKNALRHPQRQTVPVWLLVILLSAYKLPRLSWYRIETCCLDCSSCCSLRSAFSGFHHQRFKCHEKWDQLTIVSYISENCALAPLFFPFSFHSAIKGYLAARSRRACLWQNLPTFLTPARQVSFKRGITWWKNWLQPQFSPAFSWLLQVPL